MGAQRVTPNAGYALSASLGSATHAENTGSPCQRPLLDADQLEGLRLLTNADMDSHAPFACLLVGQPTLRRRIRLGAFAATDQRVALRYSMTSMDRAETADYVAHHLKLAGGSGTLFSDDALDVICQVSRGIAARNWGIAMAR